MKRILEEQRIAADMLHAGPPDQRGLRQASEDWLMEEALLPRPYYEHAGITIYHGDAMAILPHLSKVDLVLTDPPYGVAGGLGGQQHDYSKSNYSGEWDDSREYVRLVCAPIIETCRKMARTVCLTPGTKCFCFYPQPDDVGCFFTPASPRTAKFGFQTCHPIFYYGWYKDGGRGNSPSSLILTESAERNGHPCPKPIRAWKWLLARPLCGRIIGSRSICGQWHNIGCSQRSQVPCHRHRDRGAVLRDRGQADEPGDSTVRACRAGATGANRDVGWGGASRMKCLETRWVSGVLCTACGELIYCDDGNLMHFPAPERTEAHHADCCGLIAPDPRAAEYMAASDKLAAVATKPEIPLDEVNWAVVDIDSDDKEAPHE